VTCPFFASRKTEGQADGCPLQLSLARALTASYGLAAPIPDTLYECSLDFVCRNKLGPIIKRKAFSKNASPFCWLLIIVTRVRPRVR
jgi:hypothetical protein